MSVPTHAPPLAPNTSFFLPSSHRHVLACFILLLSPAPPLISHCALSLLYLDFSHAAPPPDESTTLPLLAFLMHHAMPSSPTQKQLKPWSLCCICICVSLACASSPLPAKSMRPHHTAWPESVWPPTSKPIRMCSLPPRRSSLSLVSPCTTNFPPVHKPLAQTKNVQITVPLAKALSQIASCRVVKYCVSHCTPPLASPSPPREAPRAGPHSSCRRRGIIYLYYVNESNAKILVVCPPHLARPGGHRVYLRERCDGAVRRSLRRPPNRAPSSPGKRGGGKKAGRVAPPLRRVLLFSSPLSPPPPRLLAPLRSPRSL